MHNIDDLQIGVIVPTFQRPTRLQAVVDNIHENTTLPHKITFVLEPTDTASIEAAKATDEEVLISKYPGNHTGAANSAYEETNAPFFIIANDDFNFHKNWDIEAMKEFEDPKVGVVGVNDGQSSGYTAITVVRRKYIEEQSGCMDIPNTLYYPGYNHNYVDTEFSRTAMKRNAFRACPSSVVEHMHWAFGKNTIDPTYDKSNKTSPADNSTYQSRQHLWQ